MEKIAKEVYPEVFAEYLEVIGGRSQVNFQLFMAKV
jgi:tRNA threonylcarbamoyladenosine modification (KEOPS) complex  Pcc1 subunit